MRGLLSIYRFSSTRLIHSLIQGHECLVFYLPNALILQKNQLSGV